MRKILLSMMVAVTLILTCGYASAAELKVADVIDEIEVNGFVSAGYNFNFNEPSSDMINFRPFQGDDNSFALELAQLAFHRDAAEAGSAGFMLDLNFGYTVPKNIHSTGFSGSDDFDVRQGYISYVAPVGSGLKLDFGKFITELGAEVIEGYQGWNNNYSRSLLFFYSIPFTHTGLRASYTVNDRLTLVGEVVNGWDNVTDNNDAKSWHIHAAITPVDGTTVNVKYMGGAEQDDDTANLRHLLNINLSTSIRKLQMAFDYVYGTEENVPGLGDSTWTGIAGVFRYPYTDRFSMNLRAEYFNDNEGARTGTKQEMWEVTLTPEYIVNDNLVVRAEYRHDQSDANVFDEDTVAQVNNQDTLGLNVIYHF